MDLYPSCATGRHAVGEITLACGPAVKITILSQGEKQRVIRSHYACTQSTHSMGIDAAIRRDQDPDRAESIRAKSNSVASWLFYLRSRRGRREAWCRKKLLQALNAIVRFPISQCFNGLNEFFLIQYSNVFGKYIVCKWSRHMIFAELLSLIDKISSRMLQIFPDIFLWRWHRIICARWARDVSLALLRRMLRVGKDLNQLHDFNVLLALYLLFFFTAMCRTICAVRILRKGQVEIEFVAICFRGAQVFEQILRWMSHGVFTPKDRAH